MRPLTLSNLLALTLSVSCSSGVPAAQVESHAVEISSSIVATKEMKPGCVRGNCSIGYGVRLYADGSRYKGMHRNGVRHGRGEISYPNGDVYTGNFRENLREGTGEYFFKNGIVFRGLFLKGRPEGRGSYTLKNGRTIEGEFKEGVLNGELISDSERMRVQCVADIEAVRCTSAGIKESNGK